MTAVRPLPAVLTGRFVRLEPLTTDLLPDLHRAIAVPEVFAGGYGGGPAGLRQDLGAFTEWALAFYRWHELPFAVRRLGGNDGNGGNGEGTIVGTSSLADLDLPTESAQLGWTAYAPSVWGTEVNAETKLLLLGHAFDSGFGRITIQADSRNERSRAAISGLGAVLKGSAAGTGSVPTAAGGIPPCIRSFPRNGRRSGPGWKTGWTGSLRVAATGPAPGSSISPTGIPATAPGTGWNGDNRGRKLWGLPAGHLPERRPGRGP